jgi:hypothetical protein
LRERAEAGDPDAAERLVMWLLERDRGTDLRAHVSSGDAYGRRHSGGTARTIRSRARSTY